MENKRKVSEILQPVPKKFYPKVTKWRIVLYSLVALTVFIGYGVFCNYTLSTSHYQVKSAKIPTAFDGYKILQIADLHGTAFGKEQSNLLARIDKEKPDVILLTGDTLDDHYEKWENALSLIRILTPNTPVYFVLGNHEYWTNEPSRAAQAMEQAGAVYLRNRFVKLSQQGESILLCGIEDPTNWSIFDPKVSEEGFLQTLQSISPDETLRASSFSVLLSHRPEFQQDYAKNGFDLTLSGHAHGGQIRLPFTQGLFAPNQGFFPKLTAGMHSMGDKRLIVSRGLGNNLKLIRFNNSPEIVVVTLKREE